MLTLDQLNAQIRATLAPLTRTEKVPLDAAVGRVLAEAIVSPIAMPGADVSAMDGYAFAADAGEKLRVVGQSIAGKPFTGTLTKGECVRIMTGAVVPQGADTVEMQENVQRDGEHITFTQPPRPGSHIRRCGEEVRIGEAVLAPGALLTAAHLLLLASLGIAKVQVYARLRVALLSTGDELTPPGDALQGSGQIYDSNRFLLKGALASLPVEIVDMGIIRDDPAAITAALQQAAACDVIITSGGVSVGDYDFLKDAVSALGTIHSYKVKMKPGKPFVFGHIGNAVYFGLPGNPVSGFVGFSQIVRPALWQLAGAHPAPLALFFPATLTTAIRKQPGRRDFQRGILVPGADGWEVAPQGVQDSHRVYGLARANCLIDLPEERGDCAAGEMVRVWPFIHAMCGGD